MIFSLMRLKSQINRSKALTDHTEVKVAQQLDEERDIDRKFRLSVEVINHVLGTFQNERNMVTSDIQSALHNARKTLETRGTNASINSRRNGKEAVPVTASGARCASFEVAWAKN